MGRRILIRADGSPTIGLGHLNRCLSLAQMLHKDFEISFVCKLCPESMKGEIMQNGFSFVALDREETLISLLVPTDILVVDHYELGLDFQRLAKYTGCKLVLIDDLKHIANCADLIINHAPGVTPANYNAPPDAKFALGPQYALLKPVFLEQAIKDREIRKADSLFICFGGADPENLTATVLDQLLQIDRFSRIFVVTGAAYRYLDDLQTRFAGHPNIQHYHNVRDIKMLDLMLQSDVAIVPSSGILFECLAAGCKVISTYYIDNQKAIFEGFKALNAIYPINDFLHLTDDLITNATGFKTEKVMDGRSGERFIEVFKQL